MIRGAQVGIENRRQQISRIDEFLIKPTAVSGRILVEGAGEVIVDIHFPVWFSERPIFTYGGELAEGQFVQALSMPTISGIIEKWEMKKENRIGGGYYIGASIICVTTGKPDQSIWLHWRMEGKAITNPSLTEEL